MGKQSGWPHHSSSVCERLQVASAPSHCILAAKLVATILHSGSRFVLAFRVVTRREAGDSATCVFAASAARAVCTRVLTLCNLTCRSPAFELSTQRARAHRTLLVSSLTRLEVRANAHVETPQGALLPRTAAQRAETRVRARPAALSALNCASCSEGGPRTSSESRTLGVFSSSLRRHQAKTLSFPPWPQA